MSLQVPLLKNNQKLTTCSMSCAESDEVLLVTLVQRYADEDFAILQAESDREFVPPLVVPAEELEGTNLVLGSFRIGVSNHTSEFSRRLGFMTVEAILCSLHGHLLAFSCATFAGKPGAALLLSNGRLVGLHVAAVNALQKRIWRKKVVGRLEEVEHSLDAIVSGNLVQISIAVVASVFAH